MYLGAAIFALLPAYPNGKVFLETEQQERGSFYILIKKKNDLVILTFTLWSYLGSLCSLLYIVEEKKDSG